MLDHLAPADRDVAIDIRSGDKASELLKYLALSAGMGTVVWGSDEAALKGPAEGLSRHWLSKVKTELHCPVVTSRLRRL